MTTKEALAEIARPTFPTLEVENSDRLDFAEISKWQLKAMLEAAYTRGLAEATADSRLAHNR